MNENGRRVPRHVRLILFGAVALLAMYMGASALIADRVWHPTRKAIHTDPGKYGLAYETVSFSSDVDNVRLEGWFIETPGTKTVMVLHGSSSTRDNYINMEMSRELAARGYDVFLFDFRGHGGSGGELFSLGSWETRDIAGALRYLKGRGVEKIGVLAYSMGAAAALLAAPEHPEIEAIVADSSFASLETVIERQARQANVLAPLFVPGMAMMSKLIYGIDVGGTQPKSAVARLGERPLFLIHAEGDTLIPASEARELEQAGAGNPNLQVWIAPGVAHVSAFAENRVEYVRRTVGFFDRYLGQTNFSRP